MVSSVSAALGAAGYSWTASGKDRDGDGKVTREEFKLPVAPGTGTIVPADLRAGSLDDAFDAYDRNRDGVIDKLEIDSGTPSSKHGADRFAPGWDLGMTTEKALAYFNVVNADNARLAEEWGLKF